MYITSLYEIHINFTTLLYTKPNTTQLMLEEVHFERF